MHSEDEKNQENIEQTKPDFEDIALEEDAEHTIEESKKLISRLRDRLKTTESEKQEYLNGWQRAKADFINTRKKDEETNREYAKFAKSDLILELIPVLDSFDMAFTNKESWEKLPENWRKGVEHIHSQILGILGSHSLKEINPKGQEFDPSKEEAVATIETKNADEDGVVLEVMQKGYELHGKVIRSARVKVGKLE